MRRTSTVCGCDVGRLGRPEPTARGRARRRYFSGGEAIDCRDWGEWGPRDLRNFREPGRAGGK